MNKNIITSDRSPKQALGDLLAAPGLIFGNTDQIEGLLILRLAEQLIELPRECPDCDGEGEIEFDGGQCDRCGRDCPHCADLEDVEKCDKCEGSGEVGWSRDEVYALRISRIWELLEEHEVEIAA